MLAQRCKNLAVEQEARQCDGELLYRLLRLKYYHSVKFKISSLSGLMFLPIAFSTCARAELYW